MSDGAVSDKENAPLKAAPACTPILYVPVVAKAGVVNRLED